MPGGMVLAANALIGWGWPEKKDEVCEPPRVEEMVDEERKREAAAAADGKTEEGPRSGSV